MTNIKRIPLSEYARQEGKAYQTIRDKVARGTLKGEKVKGTWFVFVDDSIQVDETQSPQRDELKDTEKANDNMTSIALSSQFEVFKAMVEQRAEENQKLQDQINFMQQERAKDIKGKGWQILAVCFALIVAVAIGLWFGWNSRDTVAKKTVEAKENEVSRLVEGLKRQESRLEEVQEERLSLAKREVQLEGELGLQKIKSQEAREQAEKASQELLEAMDALEVIKAEKQALEDKLKASDNLKDNP